MKSIVTLAVIASFLAACSPLNLRDMSAAQIKATNGMATCATSTSMYGKVSIISANTQDATKGSTEKGSTTIVCGDSTMKIDSSASPK